MFAFCQSEKMEKKSLFYPSAPSSLVLLVFFQFLLKFLIIPTKNRLSLNNKGTIFALRGEGYSLCMISTGLDIERRAKKNCMEELDEYHSRVPQLSLQIHAMPNAGHGGCPLGQSKKTIF